MDAQAPFSLHRVFQDVASDTTRKTRWRAAYRSAVIGFSWSTHWRKTGTQWKRLSF